MAYEDLSIGESFNFYKEVFTKNFTDADGDLPCEVVILSLPDASKGKLNYEEKEVEIGDCFPVQKANLLSFLRLTNDAILTSFNFKISDNNQNKLYSNMAVVTINIAAYVNLKPDEVGDLAISMAHAATKIFTITDFTTSLVPAYHDPEGDAPSKLKVLSLPTSGLLKLNGVNVTVNQEILFSQIIAGNFIYVADGTVMTAITTSFNFSVADSGSGLFTS